MNHPRRTHIFRCALAGAVVSSWFLLGVARGQDTTTTSTEHGQPTVTTQVHSGTVVYVSGNELVVKTDDGTIKDFNVPDSARVTVDGKSLSVHELQPGMRLTRTITTTTTPKTVQTIRTISGKVWHVNPPHGLILTLPEGNKQYKVPDGTMFDVNGTKESIFQIRKGMTVTATIIRESPETLVSSTRTVTGEAPPPPATPPPPTPTMVGVILIEQPAPASPPPQEVAENTLPKTGSDLPLVGLFGLLFLCAAFGLRGLRARFNSNLRPSKDANRTSQATVGALSWAASPSWTSKRVPVARSSSAVSVVCAVRLWGSFTVAPETVPVFMRIAVSQACSRPHRLRIVSHVIDLPA